MRASSFAGDFRAGPAAVGVLVGVDRFDRLVEQRLGHPLDAGGRLRVGQRQQAEDGLVEDRAVVAGTGRLVVGDDFGDQVLALGDPRRIDSRGVGEQRRTLEFGRGGAFDPGPGGGADQALVPAAGVGRFFGFLHVGRRHAAGGERGQRPVTAEPGDAAVFFLQAFEIGDAVVSGGRYLFDGRGRRGRGGRQKRAHAHRDEGQPRGQGSHLGFSFWSGAEDSSSLPTRRGVGEGRPTVRSRELGLYARQAGKYSDSGEKPAASVHTVARQSRIHTGFPRTLDGPHPSRARGATRTRPLR